MMTPRADSLSSRSTALHAAAPRPWAVFFLAAVPLLLLYASTRARTVTGEDSGELVTAAYQLGVAHPPGYPLWVLLTKAFQTVCSGVNPADAAALASSVTTAAAIGLLALLAFRLTRSAPASLLGAWCIGVGHEIWNHATIAEIYPLNLFLLAACLLLFDRWRESPTRSRLFALALVYGCGLANHPTFHLFLPIFAIAVIARMPRILLDWRAIGLTLAGFLLPHLAYLQVWIAAANDPYVSWGVEPTLQSVFAHYTREVYSAGPPKTDSTIAKVLRQLGAQGAFIAANLTVLGCLAALMGSFVLFRRDRLVGFLLLSLLVVGTIGLLPFIKFDVEREELFASRVFLMPAYLVAGVGIAAAATELFRTAQKHGSTQLVRFGLLLVPIVAAAAQYPQRDRSSYFWAEDYGRAILSELPKGAVILPGGDTATFPLLYLQGCEGFRKDVAIIDRSGTIERDEALALLPEAARARFKDAPREALQEGLLTLSGRPVVMLRPERLPPEADLVLEPFGLGFMAIPASDKKVKEAAAEARAAFFAKLRFRNESKPTASDYTSDVIRSHLAQARAVNYFRLGNPPLALEQIEHAASFSRGIKETFNNLGSTVAEHGLPDRSERFFREALAIRGDYQLARQNLVVVLRNQGKTAEAFAEARFGARLDPADPFFFEEATGLAVAFREPGALYELCEARIRAVPEDPVPHRLLGEWALDRDRAPLVARTHLEAAIAIDPTDRRAARRLKEARKAGDSFPASAEAAGADPEREEIAALIPPPITSVRRDLAPQGRRRRFARSDPAESVIGISDVQAILGSPRIPFSVDPVNSPELRSQKRTPTKAADPGFEPVQNEEPER